MKSSGITDVLIKGVIYLLIQFLLLNNITLFGAAQAWVYIALIINLPTNFSKTQGLVIAFCLGIVVDIFSNTLGMHTASAVLIAFLKPTVFNIFSSQISSSNNSEAEPLTIRTHGLSWFLMFAGSLIFIYNIAYYFIDAAGFNWFGFTLKKIILSSFFTLFTVVILQYIVYPSRSKR